MKSITKSLLFLVFLINTCSSVAQISPDAGLWSTATFECDINKKIVLFVTEEMRLRENFTRLNLFYTNVGLEYKISKNFKTSLAYRPSQKFMSNNMFSLRHRIQWDVTVKKSFWNLNLSYRHRLQAEGKNMYSSDKGLIPEWFSRNKFQVKYDLHKPVSPYFSVELRYQIHDPRNQRFDHDWHRVRYQGGFDYKINKHHCLGLYHMIQKEFNIANPETLYITGIEYTYKL
ncbi:MAG: hypothetical protein A3F72_07040 [Bacteroidetes bacterium RIFCSPLOWO2_12_FULL_35_15]|nr:MAG: hypothetical protein A3F72_07040 [Bacteroidetes bacterium RIFCSPLOWO2_12_FULL_35_15]